MEKHSSCLKIEVNDSYKEKKFVFKYETEPKFLRNNSERKSLFNGYNLWILMRGCNLNCVKACS